MKAEINDKIYRFNSYRDSRKKCPWCRREEKLFGIMVRVVSPYKAEHFICYECLIEMLEEQACRNAAADTFLAARKKLQTERYEQLAYARALKKIRAEIKEKENGALSPTVADVHGEVPSTEEKNDRLGIGDGAAERGIVSLVRPKEARKEK